MLALAVPIGADAANPVPSLQPHATAKLWRTLVQRRSTTARSADCTPLRLLFYAPSDWLRLATKLAANQVPCAQYYISIPPLAADKTNFRPDQPWRIRALGPNFHAVAEISYNGWGSWTTANGKSWAAAGVEARTRMAAQGFDVAAGDTWVVNESSSAVRTGSGVARQNLRDLVRGLYTGGGGSGVKGAVFVVGVGQTGTSLSTYKGTLQLWFADSAFWTDVSTYVSDWSQEAYGDVRKYAVAGAPPDVRRDELNTWLQHPLTLANAGPDDIATAKGFLQSAYSPLANAAWRYPAGAGFGWTDVSTEQMQDYVSAQTYALRTAGTHFGFAWAPKRPDTETATQFAIESGALLDRLAAAIHDSDAVPQAACAESCTMSIDGSSFNDGWSDFSTWSTPAVVFANAPVKATTGTAAGPLTAQLQVAGVKRPDAQPVSVTVTSSSPQGSFATTPAGPWSPTLTLQIPAGSTEASFYYRDTKAGLPLISIGAPGRAGAEQIETIVAATPPSIPPKTVPALRVVRVSYALAHGRLRIAVTTVDSHRRRVAHTAVRLSLRRNGRWVVAATVRTGARGVGVLTRRMRSGCYSVNVVRAKARGLAWNRVTPKNGFCGT